MLRSEKEWAGRKESIALFDEILDALRAGDIKLLGELTTRHFFGPLQTIIPWATTFFTERLIDAAEGGIRGSVLGVLDAGRDVGRGDGFYL